MGKERRRKTRKQETGNGKRKDKKEERGNGKRRKKEMGRK